MSSKQGYIIGNVARQQINICVLLTIEFVSF